MILLLPFLYLVLCYCTETISFVPKWGMFAIIIGLMYDIAMKGYELAIKMCDK